MEGNLPIDEREKTVLLKYSNEIRTLTADCSNIASKVHGVGMTNSSIQKKKKKREVLGSAHGLRILGIINESVQRRFRSKEKK